MSLILLSMLALQQPAVVLDGGPAAWLSPADYPPDARRKGVEGRVGIRFVVDVAGRVRDCEIASSSGSAQLDETTCRLAEERGRYQPAVDAAGRATTADLRLTFTWRIEGDDDAVPAAMFPRTAFAYTVRAQISGTDEILSCTIDAGSHVPPGLDFCTGMRSGGPQAVRWFAPGRGHRTFVMETVRAFDGTDARLSRSGDANLIGRVVSRFTLSDQGRVTACSVVEQTGWSHPTTHPCNIFTLQFENAADDRSQGSQGSQALGIWIIPAEG